MNSFIATVSILGELCDKLFAIAKAGFDGVEVFEQDFVTYDGTPRDVGALVADHGLKIDLFQPFRDFEGLPGAARARAFDRAERKFDPMAELGTDLLLVSSSTNPEALGCVDRIADFSERAERAARRRLRIGYEAVAWGRHVTDYRDAWEVVRRAGQDNVGLILDSFHTLAAGVNPEPIRAIPADRIFHVQFSDVPTIGIDLQYLSRHFRCMPGEGDRPILDFARAVMATGYAGALSIEIMNDQFRGGIPRIIAADGYRSLVYLMDQVRRAELDGQADLPPRARAEGVESIEFTADRNEANTLEGMLRGLGFSPAGRHVSKQLSLWRQGAINLVMNTEEEGFAHSAHAMPGQAFATSGSLSAMPGRRWSGRRRLGRTSSARNAARTSSTFRRCAVSAARSFISSTVGRNCPPYGTRNSGAPGPMARARARTPG